MSFNTTQQLNEKKRAKRLKQYTMDTKAHSYPHRTYIKGLVIHRHTCCSSLPEVSCQSCVGLLPGDGEPSPDRLFDSWLTGSRDSKPCAHTHTHTIFLCHTILLYDCTHLMTLFTNKLYLLQLMQFVNYSSQIQFVCCLSIMLCIHTMPLICNVLSGRFVDMVLNIVDIVDKRRMNLIYNNITVFNVTIQLYFFE